MIQWENGKRIAAFYCCAFLFETPLNMLTQFNYIQFKSWINKCFLEISCSVWIDIVRKKLFIIVAFCVKLNCFLASLRTHLFYLVLLSQVLGLNGLTWDLGDCISYHVMRRFEIRVGTTTTVIELCILENSTFYKTININSYKYN